MTEYGTATADLDGYVPFPDERIKRYLNRGYWRNRTFHELLDRTAAEAPDRPAVIGPTRTVSYGQLADRTRRIATALTARGVGPDDTIIGLQLPNCVEFLEAFFACTRLGAIPVLLLPRHRHREVRHVLEVNRAVGVVTVDDRYDVGFDYVGMVNDIADDLPHLEHRIAVTSGEPPTGWTSIGSLRDDGKVDGTVEKIDVNPCNPGLMMLSGGTSGLPKSIPRTHNDYTYLFEHVAKIQGVETNWTLLPGVPLPHSFGCGYIFGTALWAGATLAVEPRLKPESLARSIDRTEADLTALIPKQLSDLLEFERDADVDCSTLQIVCSGGQKVPPERIRRVVERWNVGFVNVYGMGEGAQITTRPEDPLDIHTETVGRPVGPGDEVRILSDQGEPIPAGEVGELVVRGPGVFTGYLSNPEANSEDFDEGGWFHTGDLFARRSDGNFQVFGRLDDTINRAGETIFAPAIEDILVEHPAVKNAGVVGIPDKLLGERVGAFVELTDDANALTVDEVRAFFEEQGVAVFKTPERIEVVTSLPETRVGKIDRPALRDRVNGN